MKRDRYRLVIEGPALDAYRRMAPERKAAVYSALECLETDPYVDTGGVIHFRVSGAFWALKKMGIDVRRFKAFGIQDLRVFYYVDEMEGTVIVKEIVTRAADTYQRKAPHAQRLIENYQKWLKGRIQ